MLALQSVMSLALGSALSLAVSVAAVAAPTPSPNDVTAALRTIKRDADQIAAGKYHGKSLQAPAHQIGVQWYKVEPILLRNGSIIVEMRMANRAITNFDKTWKVNSKARGAAKDVSSTVADLIATRQQNPRRAPASVASAAPATGSPAPSAASAQPTGSPSAAPSSRPTASSRP